MAFSDSKRHTRIVIPPGREDVMRDLIEGNVQMGQELSQQEIAEELSKGLQPAVNVSTNISTNSQKVKNIDLDLTDEEDEFEVISSSWSPDVCSVVDSITEAEVNVITSNAAVISDQQQIDTITIDDNNNEHVIDFDVEVNNINDMEINNNDVGNNNNSNVNMEITHDDIEHVIGNNPDDNASVIMLPADDEVSIAEDAYLRSVQVDYWALYNKDNPHFK